MSEELKPCPFCGGEAEIDFSSVTDFGGFGHQTGWCECLNCGLQIDLEFNADDKSINPTKLLTKKWNTRGPQSDWISVDDGLPTKGKSAKQWLCKRKNGKYVAAWWDGKRFYVGYTTFDDVTEWRTLI